MILARDVDVKRNLEISKHDRTADSKDVFLKIGLRNPLGGICIPVDPSRSHLSFAQGYRRISYQTNGGYQPLCDTCKKSDNTT